MGKLTILSLEDTEQNVYKRIMDIVHVTGINVLNELIES